MSNPTTTRPVRQRKPLAPVSGTCNVLHPVGTIGPVENRVGEVSINGKAYFLRLTPTCYSLFGFDVRKGQPTHYDIAPDFTSCDCPDGTYRSERPEGCKHCKALAALVSKGKIPVINPPVCQPAGIEESEDDCYSDEMADALAEAWHSQYDAA